MRATRLWPALAALGLIPAAAALSLLFGNAKLDLFAPPFAGHYDLRLGRWLLVLVPLAGALWAYTPAMTRLSWPRLLLVSSGMAVAWSVALALVDGVDDGLQGPLLPPGEYLDGADRIDDVPRFVRSFTDNIVDGPDRLVTQVAGHPPLLVLLLVGLKMVGLGGPWPLVVLFVLIGCSSVAAVLIAVRAVVDEATARACAPFLALAPAAIWIAVSADAVFTAVPAWGLAALAVSRSRPRGDLLALLGGVVLGLALLLSYGAVPLGLVALALLGSLRRLALASVGVAAVLLAFLAAGFWWLDGLFETLIRVQVGSGGYRPYEYFVIGNLACLVALSGPPTVSALVRVRRSDPLWRLSGVMLVAVLVTDLSGASRAEVERIWLPFAPWLVVATARLDHPRRWLAFHVAFGLVLALTLRAKW